MSTISRFLLLALMQTAPPLYAVIDDQRILEAFQTGSYAQVARDLEADLAAGSGSATAWIYLGALRNRLGRHAEACDAFARGFARIDAPLADRMLLSLRAASLAEERCYAAARGVLARLAEAYPHSSLASSDHPLVQRIARLLRQGVTAGHLAWYQREALAAHAAGRVGLACDLLREYILLARTGPVSAEERDEHILLLSTWYRQMGSAEQALVELVRLQRWNEEAELLAVLLLHSGDRAYLRRRLQTLADGPGPAQDRARALLAQLPEDSE
ncbi:MAG: tetratricopeptide repeat protein [Planctomycetota bacterium]